MVTMIINNGIITILNIPKMSKVVELWVPPVLSEEESSFTGSPVSLMVMKLMVQSPSRMPAPNLFLL